MPSFLSASFEALPSTPVFRVIRVIRGKNPLFRGFLPALPGLCELCCLLWRCLFPLRLLFVRICVIRLVLHLPDVLARCAFHVAWAHEIRQPPRPLTVRLLGAPGIVLEA